MSRSKTLKSDQKFTIDKRGYYRIGGKFASKQQVAAYKSERTRRGLTTPKPKKPSRSEANRRRSQASRKGWVTRKAQNLGVYFDGQWSTGRYSFKSLLLTNASLDTIQAALDYAKYNFPDAIAVHPIVIFTDEDDDQFRASEEKGFYRNPFDKDSAEKIQSDIERIALRYDGVIITGFNLVFTFPAKKG